MKPIISVPEVHKKAWGEELWIHNSEKYCGKILRFHKDGKFSFHFHIKKEETWYITKGQLWFVYIDTETAKMKSCVLGVGQTVHLKPGVPHRLIAIEDSEVFEVSTEHFNSDSYRIEPGDSQLNVEKQKKQEM